MKKSDLYNLQRGLLSVGSLKGVKFAVMVAKNLKIVNSEIEAFNVAQKATEAFQTYDTARVALAKEYADRDDDGKPIVDGEGMSTSFRLSLHRVEFDEAWEALQEEHSEAVEAREVQMKEFKDMLDEESEVVLVTVPEAFLPAEITGAQLHSILATVED